MANIIISRTANLDRPGNTEFLSGTLFADENLAHTFAISATRNGAEIALSGVVTACFIRPDGGTVELNGTIEDGKACVTLAESCYVVTGRFKLTIFVSVDGAKTAVYCAAGNVVETTTNTIIDPGSVVPSVDDIIAEYGTMQQAVDDCDTAKNNANSAAASAITAAINVAGAVADPYNAMSAYPVGSYCTRSAKLYRCITAISTAEAWTAAHWTEVQAMEEVSDLKSAISGTALPWEIGGVNTAGLSADNTRARMSVTGKTVAPITISTTAYMVSYVYALDGTYLADESNINWAKTERTIKTDRLFRLVVRKDDNTAISASDMATLVAGVTVTFSGQGAELYLASEDANGNRFPTIKNTIADLFDSASIGDNFAISLITLLKSMTYTSADVSTLLSDLADSLAKTQAVIYNFEPRMSVALSPTSAYLGANGQRMTTEKRYFPVDNSYIYTLSIKANTASKVWVSFHFLNATAVAALDAGNAYEASDYYETAWQEFVNGTVSFDPSIITINSLPAKAVRITFAFGNSHADNVSLIGTEIDSFRYARTVNLNV